MRGRIYLVIFCVQQVTVSSCENHVTDPLLSQVVAGESGKSEKQSKVPCFPKERKIEHTPSTRQNCYAWEPVELENPLCYEALVALQDWFISSADRHVEGFFVRATSFFIDPKRLEQIWVAMLTSDEAKHQLYFLISEGRATDYPEASYAVRFVRKTEPLIEQDITEIKEIKHPFALEIRTRYESVDPSHYSSCNDEKALEAQDSNPFWSLERKAQEFSALCI